MDYTTLKIIHLTGLAMTFMGLAGILGSKMTGDAPRAQRLIFHFSYGLGLLALIVTGFALAGKLGIVQAPPGWLNAKLVIWLLAAASITLAVRFSRYAGVVLVFFVALVATAAWLAIDKPF
jgi:hypothetical protein